MDVGGGSGQLVSAVLQNHPTMRGMVFDLPRCAESAKSLFREMGVSDRAEFIAGDFFESVPKGADTVLLKSVITIGIINIARPFLRIVERPLVSGESFCWLSGLCLRFPAMTGKTDLTR